MLGVHVVVMLMSKIDQVSIHKTKGVLLPLYWAVLACVFIPGSRAKYAFYVARGSPGSKAFSFGCRLYNLEPKPVILDILKPDF